MKLTFIRPSYKLYVKYIYKEEETLIEIWVFVQQWSLSEDNEEMSYYTHKL